MRLTSWIGRTAVKLMGRLSMQFLSRIEDRKLGAKLEALPDSMIAVLARLTRQFPAIMSPSERIDPRSVVAGQVRVHKLVGAYRNTYLPQIEALRKRHFGSRRCFVIGNGPSLNRTDLTKLAGEVTFAVNGFFLKAPLLGWTPTFYVVEDHLVAEDRKSQIDAFKGPTKFFPTYLGYCFDPAPDTIFYNHQPRKSFPHRFDFSTDAAEITYAGCTVTFSCLQLAYYLGFKEIYLIGVDADYTLPSDVEKNKAYGVGV